VVVEEEEEFDRVGGARWGMPVCTFRLDSDTGSPSHLNGCLSDSAPPLAWEPHEEV